MQLASRGSSGSKEEIDKRKEKERKREEKELRKLAKAAGIKMAKPPVTLNPIATPTPAPAGVEGETKPSGFKKPGWATVGSTTPTLAPPPHLPSTAVETVTDQPPPPPPSHEPYPPSSSSISQYHPGPAPAFSSGGWATLDTGSSHSAPASDPPDVTMSPPAPPAPAPVQPSNPQPPSSNCASVSTPSAWSSPSGQTSLTPTPSQAQAQPQSHPPIKREEVTARPEASRSGWQQFRAGAPGRGRRR